MPVQLQHPDIGGTYLDRYHTAIDRAEKQEDRRFERGRLERADQRTEIEFNDTQKQKNATKVAQIAFTLNDKQKWDGFFANPANLQEFGLGDTFKAPPFEMRDQIIAQARTIGEMQGQQNADRSFGLQERGFGLQERQFAENARHNRAAEAISAAASARAGAAADRAAQQLPKFPAQTQTELTKMRETADAAAQGAAAMQNVLKQLKATEHLQGPGFQAGRNVAGVLSGIPGFSAAEAYFRGRPVSEDIVAGYDAIESASLDVAIKKLTELGGSDTNQELLTAIRTTISPNTLPEENARRFKLKLGAAQIIAQKADLATLWANKYGDLNRVGTVEGKEMSWPAFWSEYQTAAWKDYLAKTPDAFGPGARRTATPPPTSGAHPTEPQLPPGFKRVQ